jgi:hypothetical protein
LHHPLNGNFQDSIIKDAVETVLAPCKNDLGIAYNDSNAG